MIHPSSQERDYSSNRPQVCKLRLARPLVEGFASPDTEAAGHAFPDIEAVGFISPDPEAVGSASSDPSGAGSVPPDGDPYRCQPLQV